MRQLVPLPGRSVGKSNRRKSDLVKPQWTYRFAARGSDNATTNEPDALLIRIEDKAHFSNPTTFVNKFVIGLDGANFILTDSQRADVFCDELNARSLWLVATRIRNCETHGSIGLRFHGDDTLSAWWPEDKPGLFVPSMPKAKPTGGSDGADDQNQRDD